MPTTEEPEAVLLAGSRGIRLARSAAEAERELASGFRPSVVLLDMRAGRGGEAFVKRVAADPAYAAIPILGFSEGDDRLRFTLMNDACLAPDPAQLEELLRLLEEVCFALPFEPADRESLRVGAMP